MSLGNAIPEERVRSCDTTKPGRSISARDDPPSSPHTGELEVRARAVSSRVSRGLSSFRTGPGSHRASGRAARSRHHLPHPRGRPASLARHGLRRRARRRDRAASHRLSRLRPRRAMGRPPAAIHRHRGRPRGKLGRLRHGLDSATHHASARRTRARHPHRASHAVVSLHPGRDLRARGAAPLPSPTSRSSPRTRANSAVRSSSTACRPRSTSPQRPPWSRSTTPTSRPEWSIR